MEVMHPRRHSLHRPFAFAVWLVALVASIARAASAQPLDPKAVPEPLRPWVGWVLDGTAEGTCASFLGHKEIAEACAWPSRLELALDDHGGRFVAKWHVDGKRAVPLPGDDRRWPLDVKRDGARAVVIAGRPAPSVELAAGDHVVSGAFAWDSLPESLRVPPETGLLSLRVRGALVASPNRDVAGTVWLQKAATGEEGDALEFVVHRKVTDDIPLTLTTRIELHVAGKNREELLGRTLPAGFVPASLDGPLPARLEPDGRLRVQLRPGIFTILLAARSEGPVQKLTRPAPDGPWRAGDEVWVFESRNDYRVVTVQGVAAIDPQQTTLPEEWKRFPAYPMSVGATLTLEERRRGDADPPPDQLALVRTLWLDFDGEGYSVNDRITGSLNRGSRLSMLPPTELGRVSVGGHDQFITHLGSDSPAGVEVRQGSLVVNADSRIPGDPANIPAVGWANDFHQVSGVLNLPPGWLLVHASGVDDVPGTWLRHWSLLEIFVALVIALAIGRLYGPRWGVLALAMLVLTLPEDDAPKWSWLPVLGAEALFRVLPPGRVKSAFDGVRRAAVVIVVLIALPFVVEHVRRGLYPSLQNEFAALGSAKPPESETVAQQAQEERAGGAADEKEVPAELKKDQAAAPGAPPVAKTQALEPERRKAAVPYPSSILAGGLGSYAASNADLRQSNAQVYDPAAIVQTGPGLPQWQWSRLELRWSGPVAQNQRLRLFLLSPRVNLVLALARAVLLALVVLRLLPWTQRLVARGWLAAGLVAALTALPGRAQADIPDAETLHELAARLTRGAPCTPECATSSRMAIELKADALRARLEVDVTAPTAVPLPSLGPDWSPSEVLVDGHPAKGIVREQGALWVELLAGAHQLGIDGAVPDRPSLQLALPFKSHRVEVSSAGWLVSGVHEDGLADDVLQLTRQRAAAPGSAGGLDPGTLPPFVRLERTLRAGLDWQMETRVERLTPPGTPVVLQIPLLPGESVTTAEIRIEGGAALVNLGPQALQLAWHSVLEERSPVRLRATRSLAWIEVWRLDVGPIWHAKFSGIPAVHTQPTGGVTVPEWRPWPGEELVVDLSRPDGVPGQTLTIDESEVAVTPGIRATDVTVSLHIRSSRGGDHAITLPPNTQLETVTINGAEQPIRQQDARVVLPIVPGPQEVVLGGRQARGLAAFFRTPELDLGAPSVNATLTLAAPSSRWLLFVGGPRVGPAVLFWSLLLILLVVSWVLGFNSWTPLRAWQWMLLVIGLSQVDVAEGAVFVGWLLALGWRARQRGEDLRAMAFNLRQLAIVVLTTIALGILAHALYQGLLGAPEMQVRGNGSSSSLLRWFADRTGPSLPTAWMISVPILVYRAVMLAWALWIALALLGWLRWGWSAFSAGGLWRRSPRRAPPAAAPVVTPDPPETVREASAPAGGAGPQREG
jgi:hypothetical protein